MLNEISVMFATYHIALIIQQKVFLRFISTLLILTAILLVLREQDHGLAKC